MALDIKEYLKAKHTPHLFLMDSIKGIREALFEMMKDKFDKDTDAFVKQFKEQLITRINEVSKQSVFKGEKGDTIIGPPGPPGPSGYTPIAGIDYELPRDANPPTDEQLTKLIKPLIPEPIPGSPDKPEQIVNKLNTLEEELNPKIIKGWKTLKNKIASLSVKKSGGGGMGNVQHESTNVGISTTTVTTTYKIAGNGFAIWAYYQGQLIMRGTQYTVGSDFKTLTLTFVPQNDTVIDLIYLRG